MDVITSQKPRKETYCDVFGGNNMQVAISPTNSYWDEIDKLSAAFYTYKKIFQESTTHQHQLSHEAEKLRVIDIAITMRAFEKLLKKLLLQKNANLDDETLFRNASARIVMFFEEQFKTASTVYLDDDYQHPLSQLLDEFCKKIFPYIEKHISDKYQSYRHLRFPTLMQLKDPITQLSLDDFPLGAFLITEDKTSYILISDVLEYFLTSEEERPFRANTQGQKTPLTENELERLILHSNEAKTYYQSIQDLHYRKKYPFAGGMLRKLVTILYSNGKAGSGREFQANYAVYRGIDEFKKYIAKLETSDREKILNAKYGEQVLGTVISPLIDKKEYTNETDRRFNGLTDAQIAERLAQEIGTISCINSISSICSQILQHNPWLDNFPNKGGILPVEVLTAKTTESKKLFNTKEKNPKQFISSPNKFTYYFSKKDLPQALNLKVNALAGKEIRLLNYLNHSSLILELLPLIADEQRLMLLQQSLHRIIGGNSQVTTQTALKILETVSIDKRISIVEAYRALPCFMNEEIPLSQINAELLFFPQTEAYRYLCIRVKSVIIDPVDKNEQYRYFTNFLLYIKKSISDEAHNKERTHHILSLFPESFIKQWVLFSPYMQWYYQSTPLHEEEVIHLVFKNMPLEQWVKEDLLGNWQRAYAFFPHYLEAYDFIRDALDLRKSYFLKALSSNEKIRWVYHRLSTQYATLEPINNADFFLEVYFIARIAATLQLPDSELSEIKRIISQIIIQKKLSLDLLSVFILGVCTLPVGVCENEFYQLGCENKNFCIHLFSPPLSLLNKTDLYALLQSISYLVNNYRNQINYEALEWVFYILLCAMTRNDTAICPADTWTRLLDLSATLNLDSLIRSFAENEEFTFSLKILGEKIFHATFVNSEAREKYLCIFYKLLVASVSIAQKVQLRHLWDDSFFCEIEKIIHQSADNEQSQPAKNRMLSQLASVAILFKFSSEKTLLLHNIYKSRSDYEASILKAKPYLRNFSLTENQKQFLFFMIHSPLDTSHEFIDSKDFFVLKKNRDYKTLVLIEFLIRERERFKNGYDEYSIKLSEETITFENTPNTFLFYKSTLLNILENMGDFIKNIPISDTAREFLVIFLSFYGKVHALIHVQPYIFLSRTSFSIHFEKRETQNLTPIITQFIEILNTNNLNKLSELKSAGSKELFDGMYDIFEKIITETTVNEKNHRRSTNAK